MVLEISFFNKDIVKFVECASKKKVSEKIELITNGLLLKEKHFPTFSKTYEADKFQSKD